MVRLTPSPQSSTAIVNRGCLNYITENLAFMTSISRESLEVSVEDAEKAKAWVREMYRMADSKNVGMVRTFLSEDAVLNFSRTTSLQGRAALERLVTWEYGACSRIDHSIQDIRVSSHQILVKLSVLYLFKNGTQQAMKCLALWYKCPKDKRASRVDIDGDFSQVFRELSSVAGPPPL